MKDKLYLQNLDRAFELETERVRQALDRAFELEAERVRRTFNLLSATIQAQIESTEERLRPLFEEWSAILKPASKIMGDNGWWIVLDLPIDFYRDLVEAGDSVTREELTNYIVRRANYKRCERLTKMVDDWEIDVFEIRREHFAQALWAHSRKKYCVTVPALLTHFEGIIREFVNDSGWKFENRMKKFKARFPQSEDPEKELRAVMNFYNISALDSLFTPHRPGIDTVPSDVNRHAVLHGLWLDYSTQEYSTKLFLLLDMLHSMLQQHT